MSLKGGSLTVRELKTFLNASYAEDAPKELMGYTLDEKLSNLYGKVYFNSAIKKVIVAYRGTGSENNGEDWANNAVFMANSSAYKLTPRYKTAKTMTNAVLKKYKDYQIELTGHSQSGVIVNLLNSKRITNAIEVNPAYKDANLANNEYIMRSSGDIVSALTVPKKFTTGLLYPNWTKNHIRVIPAKTNNVITEHSLDILDRLDPNMKIGRGGSVKIRKLVGYNILI
jgi:hypothetical protein